MITGVSHADEIMYIFKNVPTSSLETESDEAMVQYLTSVIYRFIKTGWVLMKILLGCTKKMLVKVYKVGESNKKVSVINYRLWNKTYLIIHLCLHIILTLMKTVSSLASLKLHVIACFFVLDSGLAFMYT